MADTPPHAPSVTRFAASISSRSTGTGLGKKKGPFAKLKDAAADHEGQLEAISTMVRLGILIWSGGILTLAYIKLPPAFGIPEQKLDPTFIASVFTGVLATFGVQTAKKSGDGTMATTLGFNTTITGLTNDYKATEGSDVVVITSGVPRKPGMTREELIGINAGIVQSVAENILVHSPETIIVVVSNPMDTMTYLALKATGLTKHRIIGMGGALDSSRFKTYLSTRSACST